MIKQISMVFETNEKIDEFDIIKKILELVRLAKLNIKLVGTHTKITKEIK